MRRIGIILLLLAMIFTGCNQGKVNTNSEIQREEAETTSVLKEKEPDNTANFIVSQEQIFY